MVIKENKWIMLVEIFEIIIDIVVEFKYVTKLLIMDKSKPIKTWIYNYRYKILAMKFR